MINLRIFRAVAAEHCCYFPCLGVTAIALNPKMNLTILVAIATNSGRNKKGRNSLAFQHSPVNDY